MAVSELDIFFQTYDFKLKDNISYGFYRERLVSIKNVSGLIKISVVLNRTVADEKISVISGRMQQIGNLNPAMVKAEFGTLSLEVYLNPVKTNDSLIIETIGDMIDILDQQDIPKRDCCPLCDQQMATDEPFCIFEDYVVQAHENCIKPIENMFDAAMESHYGNPKKQSYFLGILGVILAGIIGVALYVFLESWGYFACVSTFASIGLAYFFYSKFKGKAGKARCIIVSCILELFVFLGEYFALAYSVFKGEGITLGFALSHPFYEIAIVKPIIRVIINSILIYSSLLFLLKAYKNLPQGIKKI